MRGGMTTPFPTSSILPEQGPPLRVPMTYFLTGILFFVFYSVMLIVEGGHLFDFYLASKTVASVHLLTLGFLALVMIGALCQMVPVICGKPVLPPRISLGIYAAILCGILLLVWGVYLHHVLLIRTAPVFLVTSFLFFSAASLRAVFKSRAFSKTAVGIGVSVIFLACAVVIGAGLAFMRTGFFSYVSHPLFFQTHVAFGILGWVGVLIMSVSWQVIPMFYIAPSYGRQFTGGAIFLCLLSLLLCVVALFGFWSSLSYIGICMLAFTVLALNPIYTLKILSRRKKTLNDPTLKFWISGLICSILSFALIIAVWAFRLNLPVAFIGWLVVPGWAMFIIHGMLCRIMPFLVWFHRFSSLAGKTPIPSLKKILPYEKINISYILHISALIVGAVSFLAHFSSGFRVAGVLMLLCSLYLLNIGVYVLRFKDPYS
ncbi:MAG: hypothetical protein D6808_02665 [Candidatus Dadabacteria bacterium]|nr:MAG: hypothetical protein D6808_02665 [Candidatus Dadabacteria bacterium]